MLSMDFSTNCAPNFIQLTSFKTPIFESLLGIWVSKTKDLSAQSLTITLLSRFPNYVFYINFDWIKDKSTQILKTRHILKYALDVVYI